MFSRLFKKNPLKSIASKHYDDLVRIARNRDLYGDQGAPDTVDGRFEMIVLHAVIVMNHLKQGDEKAGELSQLIFDRMFDDMDAALREMGTGDLSVGKKIREMGEVFYGRAKTYSKLLKEEDAEALSKAINRNLEREEAHPAGQKIAGHVLELRRGLVRQNPADIVAGQPLAFTIS